VTETHQEKTKTGEGRHRDDGPAKPGAQHSETAKLVAKLEQNSNQDVPGYRKGTGAGLTEHGVKTREVCSWLQVPAILQELQLAASTGNQVDLRILFPDIGDKATQAEIKKFFQSYHSKTAGEMHVELEQKLTAIQAANTIKGFDAKAFLGEFSNLSKDNKSVLSVTDVIDLNSKSSDPKSLIATLTDAAQVADGRKVALVVELPSTQAEALAASLGSTEIDRPKLSNVRVWVGSLDTGSGKKLEELTLEEFLSRCGGSSSKEEDDKKGRSGGGGSSTGASDGEPSTGGASTSPQKWLTRDELIPVLEAAKAKVLEDLTKLQQRPGGGNREEFEKSITELTEHYDRRIAELKAASGSQSGEAPPVQLSA
jgi:hypothetical protein